MFYDRVIDKQSPKPPEPTPIGHRSSAAAAHVTDTAWLSFFRMTTTIRFSLMLVLLALVSCASPPRPAVVGKWQSLGPVGAGDVMKFTADGKFFRTYLDERNGKTISGTYTLIDRTHLNVDFAFIDDTPIKTMRNVKLGPLLCVFRITGDRFDLTSPNGEVEHLKRLNK